MSRLCRLRLACATYACRSGMPFGGGGMEREKGIGRSGKFRVGRILAQLAWRWLRFQPENALSRWFAERTSGAKGRIRTIMIVALARKLLVAQIGRAHV